MTVKHCLLAITRVSFLLLTQGCTHPSAGYTDAHHVPGAGLLDDQGDGYAIGGVTFNVSPVSIRSCDHADLRMQAEVTWNALPEGARSVIIWVDDGKSTPKRWFYGGASGHAQTGNWIVDNTTLRMRDGVTGKVLAVRHIHVTQCLGGSLNTK